MENEPRESEIRRPMQLKERMGQKQETKLRSRLVSKCTGPQNDKKDDFHYNHNRKPLFLSSGLV